MVFRISKRLLFCISQTLLILIATSNHLKFDPPEKDDEIYLIQYLLEKHTQQSPGWYFNKTKSQEIIAALNNITYEKINNEKKILSRNQ